MTFHYGGLMRLTAQNLKHSVSPRWRVHLIYYGSEYFYCQGKLEPEINVLLGTCRQDACTLDDLENVLRLVGSPREITEVNNNLLS